MQDAEALFTHKGNVLEATKSLATTDTFKRLAFTAVTVALAGTADAVMHKFIPAVSELTNKVPMHYRLWDRRGF